MLLSRATTYFLEVVRCGSIRQAGEVLRISPSAIDRQILALEQHVGVLLFDRLAQGLRPTAAGEALAYALDHIRRRVDDCLSGLGKIPDGRHGKVVVAVSEGAGDFLGQALQTFRVDHPDIEIVLQVVNSPILTDQILEGQADIGLVFNPIDSPLLNVETRMSCPIGVVVPVDHELSDRASVSLQDCAGFPLLLPDHSFRLRQMLEHAWRGSVGTPLYGAITTNSMAMLKRMVMNGLGIGLVTKLDMRSEVQNGQLRFIPVRGKKPLQSTFAVIRAADRAFPPVAARLARHLSVVMAE
jgi:DNA-binding transcriptional LysR family regulator